MAEFTEQWAGRIYVGLLQMTVLPFREFSPISNFGRLDLLMELGHRTAGFLATPDHADRVGFLHPVVDRRNFPPPSYP